MYIKWSLAIAWMHRPGWFICESYVGGCQHASLGMVRRKEIPLTSDCVACLRVLESSKEVQLKKTHRNCYEKRTSERPETRCVRGLRVRSPSSFVPNTLIRGKTDFVSKSNFQSGNKQTNKQTTTTTTNQIPKSHFLFVHLRKKNDNGSTVFVFPLQIAK